MNARTAEVLRISTSMVVACAIGAALLGAVYVATDRYQEQARVAGERRAVTDMLALTPQQAVCEVDQFLAPAASEVVYRVVASPGTPPRELTFALDGTPRASAPHADDPHALRPLGRLFLAGSPAHPLGFVIEGDTRGYKNTIRFFVALDSSFEVAGVRVVEHEEDPGLGAEVATPWFQGQFAGRSAAQIATLDVTRDPMPEDWRVALDHLDREPLAEWRVKNAALTARERAKPIYAVTGATISSRALVNGVRGAVDHFRRRWQLIAPYLAQGGAS